MSAARRVVVVLLVVLTMAGVPVVADAAGDYVKYYRVAAAYDGAPETLTEIAARFLGNGSRSAEIFNLNTGRVQADGQRLTDPAHLTAGWTLVLPWDAVGEGVAYGVPGNPEPSPSPSATGSGASTGKGGTSTCGRAAASGKGSDWADERVAAKAAWPLSRGKGQLVAVVDSGVTGGGDDLAVGVDVTGGQNGGDVDCLGTGTAMAGIVHSATGVAPDATVLPIRVVATHAVTPATAVQVKALQLAVTAGATVIALGDYVDPADPAVAKAISAAVAAGIVVVHNAATTAPEQPGVLRVGAVGEGNRWTGKHSGVDVVAPGLDVQGSTGTYLAVAYAAGEAALVRTAYPDLTAAQVTHRIEATAAKVGSGDAYGWGFIDARSAVTRILGEESPTPAPGVGDIVSGPPSTQGWLIAIAAVLALGFASLLGLRLRRLMDPEPDRPRAATPQLEGGRVTEPGDERASVMAPEVDGGRSMEPETKSVD